MKKYIVILMLMLIPLTAYAEKDFTKYLDESKEKELKPRGTTEFVVKKTDYNAFYDNAVRLKHKIIKTEILDYDLNGNLLVTVQVWL